MDRSLIGGPSAGPQVAAPTISCYSSDLSLCSTTSSTASHAARHRERLHQLRRDFLSSRPLDAPKTTASALGCHSSRLCNTRADDGLPQPYWNGGGCSDPFSEVDSELCECPVSTTVLRSLYHPETTLIGCSQARDDAYSSYALGATLPSSACDTHSCNNYANQSVPQSPDEMPPLTRSASSLCLRHDAAVSPCFITANNNHEVQTKRVTDKASHSSCVFDSDWLARSGHVIGLNRFASEPMLFGESSDNSQSGDAPPPRAHSPSLLTTDTPVVVVKVNKSSMHSISSGLSSDGSEGQSSRDCLHLDPNQSQTFTSGATWKKQAFSSRFTRDSSNDNINDVLRYNQSHATQNRSNDRINNFNEDLRRIDLTVRTFDSHLAQMDSTLGRINNSRGSLSRLLEQACVVEGAGSEEDVHEAEDWQRPTSSPELWSGSEPNAFNSYDHEISSNHGLEDVKLSAEGNTFLPSSLGVSLSTLSSSVWSSLGLTAQKTDEPSNEHHDYWTALNHEVGPSSSLESARCSAMLGLREVAKKAPPAPIRGRYNRGSLSSQNPTWSNSEHSLTPCSSSSHDRGVKPITSKFARDRAKRSIDTSSSLTPANYHRKYKNTDACRKNEHFSTSVRRSPTAPHEKVSCS